MSETGSWRERYRQRTITAEEAAAKIGSGQRVVIGHTANAPRVLIEAMTARAEHLRSVEVAHLLTVSDCPYCAPGLEESFRFRGGFLSAATRAAVADGRADFRPLYFHEYPQILREYDGAPDVTLVSVSEPDEQGWVSLGVSFDYTRQAVLSGKTVIAAVKPHMPWVEGDGVLPLDEFDWFVPDPTPLPEYPVSKIGPVEEAIGRHIAELIRDGDCLQLGIGNIPDAVLNCLGQHRDLGIHSEMISDGVMTLAQTGAITGARKNIDQGKIVFTFGMGSERFYRWLDHNPNVLGKTVDYVNEPRVIGLIDNVVSINSALSVDLLGQVAADSIGARQYSGVGGQVDFVRGAHFSKGGRSIIALPSCARDKNSGGLISRICATFAPGQAVTTSRFDVDIVVTEHGAAHLRWRDNGERMRALVNIATPEFREDLARQARDIYGIRI